jgi:hypothetical protein
MSDSSSDSIVHRLVSHVVMTYLALSVHTGTKCQNDSIIGFLQKFCSTDV